MANRRDLVEAQAYNRRRLVTAFVSGAPGGREAEPARPLRVLVVGLVVAALLLTGAAVLGLVTPRAPAGWLDEGSLVASKQRGTLYLVARGRDEEGVELRPFANATSAQLLLGADAEPVRVDQSEIDGEPVGATIGILDAPTTIPERSRLEQTGWSACAVAGGGVATTLGTGAARPAPGATSDAAAVVRVDDALWLIAPGAVSAGEEPQAERFRLPAAGADTLLREVGLTARTSDAETVDAEWLDLFPRGRGRLGSTALRAGGSGPVGYADGLGREGLRVGDVVVADGGRYLLTAQGPAELDPFALAVARSDPDYTETRVDRAPEPLVAPTWPASWPSGTLTDAVAADGTGTPCAVLETSSQGPRVLLGSGSAEVADGVRVPPGHGALVRDDEGRLLVDGMGVGYPIADDDTLATLGLDVTPPEVPEAWAGLFTVGPTLDSEAAGRPPAE